MSIVLIILSMLVIWRASDGFESATEYLGRKLSDGVKGATLNAIGSSMPEFITTMIALLFYADKNGFAFGVGTTAGSAVFNGAVIPAVVILSVVLFGVAKNVVVSRKVILRDGLALIIGELLLIWILSKGTINYFDGLALVVYYMVYVIVMLKTMDNSECEEYEHEKPDDSRWLSNFITLNIKDTILCGRRIGTFTAWFILIVSTLLIGGACHLLVEACYMLGNEMGIQTYFIAVILAAAATSVPDTIISIKDAKNGNYDDAVSNALGSNVFDICFCLGFSAAAYCLYFGDTIQLSAASDIGDVRIVLLGVTVAVFLLMLKKTLAVVDALAMLFLYGMFVIYILDKAYNLGAFKWIF